MTENKKDLREYLDFIRRRKLHILVPALALFAVGALTAFLLSAVYRSSATILVEEQEVPPDLVRSTVTSYADQRIQTIKHQVMSRSNLMKIIDQYGLYAKMRRSSTTEEILDRFVKDIKVEVISAEVVDRRTGQQTHATIAFSLAYNGESPQLAQKVASELTSLFLGENLKSRERHAQETTSFLKGESESLLQRIEELEKKISIFKQRANGALPELNSVNVQMMNQVDRELIEFEQQVRALQEKKIALEGQLATLKPNTPIVTSSGERILDEEERLKALRVQFVSSASYLSDQHPDVIKMKHEIEALEKSLGHRADAQELSKQLTDTEARLAVLLERFGEDHPDVIRLRKVIASLNSEIAKSGSVQPPAPSKPENPAYILTQSQLSSVIKDIEATTATRDQLKRRALDLSTRLERTPMIEQQYLDLNRDRDNSVEKYREIRSKLLEAQVSEVLEVQRKGERFSLIDPPALPEKPEKPNRPALIIVSAAVAAAGGVGYGAAAESLDRSVRTAQKVASVVQEPPLAVIPYLPNGEDRRRAFRKKWGLVFGAIGSVIIALAAVHFLWWPLDVLWFVLLRKLGLG